ncbi:Helix-turn-helix domain-containing protein [Halogranum amylolyticum]|uniref:Helix-turn-helix domain-containing protein n=1 Tax=Halogranum amylolyticum TaxID=660520 RepID=A0A1H8S5W3_9EURY|nr:winged helix-turn-helix domain-containing protein [Halogranum amylolyticum]SEO73784.1 Helix-turn-helix domain-containing protein [Halogranum amylolyticum]
MSDDPDDAAVFRLLHDEYARAILTATSRDAMSARELADICDASLPTVYRRVDDLVAQGLVVEDTELDPTGNHYTTYEAAVEHIDIDIDNGEIDVTITQESDAADRFTRVWEDIRGGDE